MWNEEQKRRFHELRSLELRQELTEAENKELARMIHDLEEEEAAYLRPATQQIEQHNRQLAAQNIALKALLEREKRLKRYLQRVLKKVESERNAISTELASILESSPVAG